MAVKIDWAEAALEAYKAAAQPSEYEGEEDFTAFSDLVTDLKHLAREAGWDWELALQRADINTAEEPQDASDYHNIAAYHERQGHTSMAAKFYEQADDLKFYEQADDLS